MSARKFEKSLSRLLSNDPSLTFLDLEEHNVDFSRTIRLANALALNTTLAELNLQYNNIQYEGLSRLATALETNTTLTLLDLSNNHLGNAGASRIARSLTANHSLATLILSDNKIDQGAVERLATSLETNTTLTELFLDMSYPSIDALLGRNRCACAAKILLSNDLTLIELVPSLSEKSISAEGADTIARALAHNTTITNLDLGYNNVSDEGAQRLVTALETNTTLATLDLTSNNISNEGVKSLAMVLEMNSSLTALYLSHNEIDDEGTARLATALATNTTLATLDLAFQRVGDEGARNLAISLAINSTLTKLDLSSRHHNGDSALATRIIQPYLDRNRHNQTHRNATLFDILSCTLYDSDFQVRNCGFFPMVCSSCGARMAEGSLEVVEVVKYIRGLEKCRFYHPRCFKWFPLNIPPEHFFLDWAKINPQDQDRIRSLCNQKKETILQPSQVSASSSSSSQASMPACVQNSSINNTRDPNGLESRLPVIPSSVGKIVNYIFLHATRACFSQINACIYPDRIQTPLGSLTIERIQEGEFVLQQIHQELSKSTPEAESLQSLSVQYLTKIPRRTATVSDYSIDNIERYSHEMDLIQLLRDMLHVGTRALVYHDVSLRLKALGVQLDPLDPISIEYQKLMRNIPTSYLGVHISNIFQIVNESIQTQYDNSFGNEDLLYHGSHLCNFLGLLSRGLLLPQAITPLGIPRTGFGPLGAGIYFTRSFNIAVQLYNHSDVVPGKNSLLMLICSVSLGNCFDQVKCDEEIRAPPLGFDSLHGNPHLPGSEFHEDIFAIYHQNRQRPAYLLEFGFVKK